MNNAPKDLGRTTTGFLFEESVRSRITESLINLQCLGWFLVTVIEPSNTKIIFAAVVIGLASLAHWIKEKNLELASFYTLIILSSSIVGIMPFYDGAHDISLVAFSAVFIAAPLMVNSRFQFMIAAYACELYAILWLFEYRGLYAPKNPELGLHDIITVSLIACLLMFFIRRVLSTMLISSENNSVSSSILESLLENSEIAYLGISDEFKIVWKSGNFDFLTHKNCEEGVEISKVLPELDLKKLSSAMGSSINGNLRDGLTGIDTVTFGNILLNKDESPRKYEINLVPSKNASPKSYKGNSIDIFLSIVDVTDQKQAIESRFEDEARLSFVSRISHELRTPLQGMLTHTELLGQDFTLSTYQKKHIKTLGQNIRHLRSVINEVLNFSQVYNGEIDIQKSWIDIPEIINEIAALHFPRAEEKGISISVDLCSEVEQNRFLLTDPLRYRQILMNLIDNAVKNTQNGYIRIKLKVTHFDSETDHLAGKNNGVSLLKCIVEDSGKGIPKADQDRVFQAFEQVEHRHQAVEGTGLGLPISMRLAKLLGGKIELESVLDIGSRFIFSVPLDTLHEVPEVKSDSGATQNILGIENFEANLDADENHKQGSESSPELTVLNRNVVVGDEIEICKVLVVDDALMNQELMRDILEFQDCRIEFALDGEEAIERVYSFRPHLIFMDLRMPKMNGIDATKKIREFSSASETRIVGCTASAFLTDESLFLEAGVEKVIKKPFILSDVISIVEEINDQLRQNPTEDERE